MARVHALSTHPTTSPASHNSARHQRAEQVLRQLATATRPDERDDLIAQAVELTVDLADGLARRYAHRGVDLDDLVQVARLGLLLAVRRYRPAEDTSFPGFAVPTIRGEIRRHFRDHGWVVRPPRRIQELRARARVHGEELEQQLGRTPSASDLATALEVDVAELEASRAADTTFRPLSLEAGDEGASPLANRLVSLDRDLELLPDLLTLRREMRRLPSRERRVLAWRYEDGLTQREIAERLGVSQMQVSRILAGVLGQLRTALVPEPALAG